MQSELVVVSSAEQCWGGLKLLFWNLVLQIIVRPLFCLLHSYPGSHLSQKVWNHVGHPILTPLLQTQVDSECKTYDCYIFKVAEGNFWFEGFNTESTLPFGLNEFSNEAFGTSFVQAVKIAVVCHSS
jgi:hypothetical protein